MSLLCSRQISRVRLRGPPPQAQEYLIGSGLISETALRATKNPSCRVFPTMSHPCSTVLLNYLHYFKNKLLNVTGESRHLDIMQNLSLFSSIYNDSKFWDPPPPILFINISLVLEKFQGWHWRPQIFLISGNFLKSLIPGKLKTFTHLFFIWSPSANWWIH